MKGLSVSKKPEVGSATDHRVESRGSQGIRADPFAGRGSSGCGSATRQVRRSSWEHQVSCLSALVVRSACRNVWSTSLDPTTREKAWESPLMAPLNGTKYFSDRGRPSRLAVGSKREYVAATSPSVVVHRHCTSTFTEFMRPTSQRHHAAISWRVTPQLQPCPLRYLFQCATLRTATSGTAWRERWVDKCRSSSSSFCLASYPIVRVPQPGPRHTQREVEQCSNGHGSVSVVASVLVCSTVCVALHTRFHRETCSVRPVLLSSELSSELPSQVSSWLSSRRSTWMGSFRSSSRCTELLSERSSWVPNVRLAQRRPGTFSRRHAERWRSHYSRLGGLLSDLPCPDQWGSWVSTAWGARPHHLCRFVCTTSTSFLLARRPMPIARLAFIVSFTLTLSAKRGYSRIPSTVMTPHWPSNTALASLLTHHVSALQLEADTTLRARRRSTSFGCEWRARHGCPPATRSPTWLAVRSALRSTMQSGATRRSTPALAPTAVAVVRSTRLGNVQGSGVPTTP